MKGIRRGNYGLIEKSFTGDIERILLHFYRHIYIWNIGNLPYTERLANQHTQRKIISFFLLFKADFVINNSWDTRWGRDTPYKRSGIKATSIPELDCSLAVQRKIAVLTEETVHPPKSRCSETLLFEDHYQDFPLAGPSKCFPKWFCHCFLSFFPFFKKNTYFGEKGSIQYWQASYIDPHFGGFFSPVFFGGTINIDHASH